MNPRSRAFGCYKSRSTTATMCWRISSDLFSLKFSESPATTLAMPHGALASPGFRGCFAAYLDCRCRGRNVCGHFVGYKVAGALIPLVMELSG